MKGVIGMFNFLRKKEDPTLKEIDRQIEELKAISESMRKNRESLEADIQKAESLLLNMGYSQKDLDKLKTKPRLKLISESKKIES